MPQIYKIYINETVLILTDSIPPDLEDYQELNVREFKFSKFYPNVKALETPKSFLLLTKDFKDIFKKIKKSMELIKAAGGLVSNEENKYLFIFRKGKWDLPKGKLDKGESFKTAAVREVEEECGVRIDSCGEKICKTYHIYEDYGVPVIKKTVWYWMRADNQPDLVPQLEESITEAKWLAAGDFMLVRENTYPLIRDVIKVIEY
ncbi:MAG: NUDIX domain-containing protein [Daejeonella sp.]|uniref:NUDIX hydrolase n=1 Tax=Daejeonella sp. TaxID=2805397 RepID=UPI003C765313